MKSAEWEARETPDIVFKVREAQINQLYNQSWTGLTGVLVVAISICIIFWQVVPSWKLTLWLSVFTLITFARGYLTVAFQRKTTKGGSNIRWEKWHVIGTSASGLMWALPSFFLWPENAPEYHLVWAICILPLSASAVTTYFTWKPSYISFLLLSTVPISLRFFSEGGLIYIVLGFLALFFIAVLVQAGDMIHTASLRSLIVGFRNEALNSILTEEKTKQEELTHKLRKAHDKLQKVSLTDELTGLWNRRYLNTTIQKDVDQVLRKYSNSHQVFENNNSNNTNIVFIMVDLDHFKTVNDTYGHAAGDQVLIQMRHLLTNSCRNMDTTIRWGGEEFLMVLRNVDRENFTIHVERIRQAVENHQFDIGTESPIQLTCSIGIAVFPFLMSYPEVLPWTKVVDLADVCLFAAKRSGRNAWVGIIPTILTMNEDLTSDFDKNISSLIQQGKIEMKTSLKESVEVCWGDS